MARKPQQERTTTSTTLPTQNNTELATNQKPRFLSLSRFMPSRVDRTTDTAGAAGAKPKSPWRRLLFGMLIFIVAMQVFEYVLIFIQSKLSLNLNAPLGKSIPIIGSLSWFTFIYLLFMLVLYIGLLRFGVIPNSKTMRTQRATAAQSAAPASTSRSARKRAARHAATATATTVSTARRTASAGRVKSGQGQAAATTASASGIGDDVYERVKAAQRTRRRREAKR